MTKRLTSSIIENGNIYFLLSPWKLQDILGMQIKWDLKVSPKNDRIPRNMHRLIIYDLSKLE